MSQGETRVSLDAALPEPIRTLPLTDGNIPAYKLQAPGCDVLFVASPAGTGCPVHAHDTQNATLVVSGETVVITDDEEHYYSAGEWYQTKPGEMHAIRFDVDCVQIELRFDVPAAG